jgi:hypothetical protein
LFRRDRRGAAVGLGVRGIDTEGISTHGIIAMVLGTMFTVLVGVGLMALIFYSNRSGQDDP